MTFPITDGIAIASIRLFSMEPGTQSKCCVVCVCGVGGGFRKKKFRIGRSCEISKGTFIYLKKIELM